MKFGKWILIILFLIVFTIESFSAGNKIIDINEETKLNKNNSGWWFPYIGRLNGEWEMSTGVHFWSDHINLRNLQLRGNVDLFPGIRANTIIRSNKEFDSLETFDPTFDQLNLEMYGFHYGDHGKLSLSLKIGKMRYLRFPYPDLISTFDHVPGTEDLRYEKTVTGYSGQMLTLDYKSDYGIGYHFTGINWDFIKKDYNSHRGNNIIENYLYYKKSYKNIDFEARAGHMQLRNPVGGSRTGASHQVGLGGPGYSIYLGGSYKGYKVGGLYEDLYDEDLKEHDIRTGIMVTFAFSKVTDILGSVRFDYTRTPEGFVNHIPLFKGKIGSIKKSKPENGKLVGEIKAERMITYWQNGQGRNYYEHRISSWGDVSGKDTVVVMNEDTWYLGLESLVSPHTSFKTWDDLVEWEDHRQGPAQLVQPVIYKFYKID
ncbi:MAG: hypothetical protein ACQERZ_04950 [Fusobacteriota bacterium]